MLDFVRNKQKSIIVKIAFAIIILSFVIGYAMLSSPDGTDGSGPAAEAAVVNGKSISYNDFQDAYSNLYQLYQSVYQDQFTPALEKQLKLAEKSPGLSSYQTARIQARISDLEQLLKAEKEILE